MQSGQARVLWEKNRSAFCLEGFICLLLKVISFEGDRGTFPALAAVRAAFPRTIADRRMR